MNRAERALDTLDEDVRDYIERETQENIDRGMPPEEARRQALLKFGSVAVVKEDTCAVWISRRLEEMRLTAIGLGLGVVGALASSRVVSGMLFDVVPRDAVTYAGVIVGLGLLSLLATYLPARRATQIDPLRVLRQD